MAATKLIAMHVNKGRTVSSCLHDRIEYAKNGEKTENEELISTYACNKEIADKEFFLSKNEYLKNTGRVVEGDVIAYQIRQSFKPGEITAEEANKIGYETAMRFTKGYHAFLVATHTDKAHIHNHIIFNSVNLDCNRKFRNFWFSGIALQRLSDIICIEHKLSIIEKVKPSERAKRTEYPDKKTIRSGIMDLIDNILKSDPKDFDDFLKKLQTAGYEIKRGKHIAVKGENQKRFIRLDSLDKGYRQDDLKALFEKDEKCVQHTKVDPLIDLKQKMEEGKGAGYIRWAKKHNAKEIAKILVFLNQNGIKDYKELAEKADASSEKFHELADIINQKEARLTEIKELKKHIFAYSKTKDVFTEYKKSGYSKKFFEVHREEITIHRAAKKAFEQIDGKIPKVKELNSMYAEILSEKKKAYIEYQEIKENMRAFQIAKANLDEYWGEVQKEDLVEEQNQKKQKSKTEER